MCAWACTCYSLGGAVLIVIYHYLDSGETTALGIHSLSMANVPVQSPQLWASFMLAYAFTALFLYSIHKEYGHFAETRCRYFIENLDDLPTQVKYSVMVENVPKTCQKPSQLHAVFDAIFPGEVFCAQVVVETGALDNAVASRDAAQAQLEEAYAKFASDRDNCRPVMYLLDGEPSTVSKPLAYAFFLSRRMKQRILSAAGCEPVDAINFWSQRLAKECAYVEAIQHHILQADGGISHADNARLNSEHSRSSRYERSSGTQYSKMSNMIYQFTAEEDVDIKNNREDEEYDCVDDTLVTTVISPHKESSEKRGLVGSYDSADSAGGSASRNSSSRGFSPAKSFSRGLASVRSFDLLQSPLSAVNSAFSVAENSSLSHTSKNKMKKKKSKRKSSSSFSNKVRPHREGEDEEERYDKASDSDSSDKEGKEKISNKAFTGFVSFKSRATQMVACKVPILSQEHRGLVVLPAPLPSDIIWKNSFVSATFTEDVSSVVNVMYCFALVFQAAIISFVAALTNLSALEQFLPIVAALPPVVAALIEGLLPVVLLVTLNMPIPAIVSFISRRIEKRKTISDVHVRVFQW